MTNSVRAAYEQLAAFANVDLKSDAVSTGLAQVATESLRYLAKFTAHPLTSDDPDKEYFCFESGRQKSRPINARLFNAKAAKKFAAKILNDDVEGISHAILDQVIYTIAVAYCAAADILGKGADKKTPGTYFEILIGHIVGRRFGVNPRKAIEVQSIDIGERLPTDFTFDLGPGKNKIHMPIKTSTRERVIQVWAHQRVIDGVFGVGRFKGVLVCLSETNMKPGYGVTEVCLPGQWTIYQMFIAQMHRVYYLDIPKKYAALAATYPFIQVKPFSDFFSEWEQLAKAAPFS